MTVTLGGEARKRLDAHLDAVEAALSSAGKSREERRGIVDDLEARLLDMLAARGSDPTVGDVEAVLSKLDSPAAYAEAGPVRARQEAAPVDAEEHVAAIKKHQTSRWRSFMRSSVVIALIVCGTLLVMTPEIVAHLRGQEFLEFSRIALAQKVPADVNLNFDVSPMGDGWRFMFWLTGSLTILSGVIGGFVAFASERRAQRELVTQH